MLMMVGNNRKRCFRFLFVVADADAAVVDKTKMTKFDVVVENVRKTGRIGLSNCTHPPQWRTLSMEVGVFGRAVDKRVELCDDGVQRCDDGNDGDDWNQRN